MTNLIHSLADLIDERDREGLEMTLARVVFELTQARALTFWRAFRRVDGVWLRKRVELPAGARAEAPPDDTPLAAMHELVRLAFEAKKIVRWQERPEGLYVCALPLIGDADMLALIEIETEDALDSERMSVLTGLLRIYRSHLAALAWGDVDELTQLANRRSFDDHFHRFQLAEARRGGARRVDDVAGARAHLGVADIDFFKQVNDRFGHPRGDEVLAMFARLMRETFRETDRLFRFGGEEFVILLSNCGLVDALAAFERFRARIAACQFPEVGHVTVSVGVASLRPDDTGLAAFGRADQALYDAKRRGRDRVLLFGASKEAQA